MISFSQLGKYGRFGNQLFQIASTFGIAYRNSMLPTFPHWDYQEYFSKKLPEGIPVIAKKYKEPCSYYREIDLERGIHWDLEGYFQSWKYFSDIKSTIISTFYFDKVQRDGVAIHVRRGDYLALQHVHPVLPMSYYENALGYFPNEHFAIFSDDIEWCKQNFRYSDTEFVNSGSDIEDFKTMASFRKFVIANSSFSYWAAYLSESDAVISPINYVEGEVRDDRLLPEWTKL
jgi:hypothetical protein